MPYPHSSTNLTKKSTPQGSPTMADMRKGSMAPEQPTGRLVTDKASPVSHWCPDAIKSNVLEWTCDGCGAKFYWSIIAKQWFPMVEKAV